MDYRLFPAPRPDKAIRTSSLITAIHEKKLKIIIPSSFFMLDKVRSIFQRQLPKMPREYIFRQVFDLKHKTLCLIIDNEIVGGICYRPFYKKNFVEIVFCAIESDVQVKGYGGVMMDLFKEHVKTEYWYNDTNEEINVKKCKVDTENIQNDSIKIEEKDFGHVYSSKYVGINTKKAFELLGYDILTYKGCASAYLNPIYTKRKDELYLMTYADNYAIGYFKKNGFTTKITTDCWVGFIKDYDGGTIMQGRIFYEINYLRKEEFILEKRKKLYNDIMKVSTFNKLYPAINPQDYKNVYEIPGMVEAKLTDQTLLKIDKGDNILYVIEFLFSDLLNHTSAWPFLQPVNPNEVTDYYTIIKNPMDLSKIESKIGKYMDVAEFSEDVALMFSNCLLYNLPGTQYYKCAQILKDFYDERVKIFKNIMNK